MARNAQSVKVLYLDKQKNNIPCPSKTKTKTPNTQLNNRTCKSQSFKWTHHHHYHHHHRIRGRPIDLRRTSVRQECAQLFITTLKCNPTYSSQKSIFSLFLWRTDTFFWWEWLLSWERLPLMRPIFVRHVRRMMPRHFTGGSLIMVICFWAKNVFKHGPGERWLT